MKEAMLWLCVIRQALEDAILMCPPGVSQSATARQAARKRARDWFTDADGDFIAVCGLANVDSDRAREHALAIIAEADRWTGSDAVMKRRGVVENFVKLARDRRGCIAHDLIETGFSSSHDTHAKPSPARRGQLEPTPEAFNS